MDRVIGIDFGTTNSCVAVAETGGITVIPCEQGSRTLPSVVAFTERKERLIGAIAKRQAVTNPERTIYSVKRLLGRRFDSEEIKELKKRVPYTIVPGPHEEAYLEIEGKEVNPLEIAGMVIRRLKEHAEEYLGEKVKDAVITTPAYYDNAQREATRNAATLSGLNILRIINEPTAASIAYGIKEKAKGEKLHRIAIFDLGGGTFDISILSLYKGTFEVMATAGDTFLGGDDFDQKMLEYITDNFLKETGTDLTKDMMALQRLKEGVERVKNELSSTVETELNIPFIAHDNTMKPLNLRYTFKRALLENLCSDLIQKLEDPCMKALEDSKLSIGDIEEVLLVGGMTRMPKIQEKVAEIFRKQPNRTLNPDEIVAVGAAIEGSALKGTIKDILLLDVIPLSMGIETAGGLFTRIIPRNTTIPARKSEIFTTTLDNQPMVSVHILQGEREMAQDNRTLGRFELLGIPPAPRGYPQIEVKFEVDTNGILNVSACDLGTGKKQGIKITSHSSLSKEELERMKKEAEIYAREDIMRKELAEQKNRLESLMYNIRKTIEEYGDRIESHDMEAIEKSISLCREVLKSNDPREIDNAIETMNISIRSIADVIYKEAAEKVDIAEAKDEGKGEGEEEKKEWEEGE